MCMKMAGIFLAISLCHHFYYMLAYLVAMVCSALYIKLSLAEWWVFSSLIGCDSKYEEEDEVHEHKLLLTGAHSLMILLERDGGF